MKFSDAFFSNQIKVGACNQSSAAGGPQIKLVNRADYETFVDLQIGHPNNCSVRFCPESLREAAELFERLADALEKSPQ